MSNDKDRLTRSPAAGEPRPTARFATRGARTSGRQFTDRKHAVVTFKSLYEARDKPGYWIGSWHFGAIPHTKWLSIYTK